MASKLEFEKVYRSSLLFQRDHYLIPFYWYVSFSNQDFFKSKKLYDRMKDMRVDEQVKFLNEKFNPANVYAIDNDFKIRFEIDRDLVFVGDMIGEAIQCKFFYFVSWTDRYYEGEQCTFEVMGSNCSAASDA